MGFLDFLPLIGDVVSGLFGAAGTSSSNATNLQAVRETNQAQRELAEYQWEQNIQQWKRENEYNSPQEQMNRLAQAGLNPYLVYSNGNAIMPAGNSPNYEAPNLQAYQQQASPLQDIGRGVQQAGATMFDNFMRKQFQEAQLTKLWYDNEYTAQRTKVEQINETLAMLDGLYKQGMITKQDIENEWLPAIYGSSVLESSANINQINQKIANMQFEGELIQAQTAATKAAEQLTQAQRLEALKMIEKHEAEINEIISQINLNNQQAALAKAQALKTTLEAEWTRQFGPGKSFIDSALNSPSAFLGGIERLITSLGSVGNRIGLAISKAIVVPGTKNKVDINNPVTIGLKGFSTLAPGPAGSVSGFRLR